MFPPETLGRILPFYSSFWWLQAFLGLWLHQSHLRLSLHVAFSSSVSLPSVSCKDTCDDIEAQLGNLG